MTAARSAGVFLLLTALATAISVQTRLLADADQPTLAESLLAIIANRGYYAARGGTVGVGISFAGGGVVPVAGHGRLPPAGGGSGRRVPGRVRADYGGVRRVRRGDCRIAADRGAAGDGLPNLKLLADARWFTGTLGFTLAGLGTDRPGAGAVARRRPAQNIRRRRRDYRRRHAVHLVRPANRDAPHIGRRLPAVADCERGLAGRRPAENTRTRCRIQVGANNYSPLRHQSHQGEIEYGHSR